MAKNHLCEAGVTAKPSVCVCVLNKERTKREEKKKQIALEDSGSERTEGER